MSDDPSAMHDQQHIPAYILDAEHEYIRSWRSNTGRQDKTLMTGLALSGGGIRSAVYCLGALQAFSKHGILERFDYLSTVSGGGYIGSSLTWCTSPTVNEFLRHNGQKPFGVRKEDLPFDIDDPLNPSRTPARANSLLRHLRRHGSYLLPGHGIDLVSGIAVVLRGMVLNLAVVWLPIITTIMVLLLLERDEFRLVRSRLL